MKKKYYIFLMLLSFSGILFAGSRITLFFQQEPLTDTEKIRQKIRKPGKLAKYTAQGILKAPIIEGILATYGGYITASDYNGEVSFPRKHQKNSLTIMITPEIAPIALFENTILHWNRVPGVPAVMYECEQGYDEEKGEYYWQTNEGSLSEDMRIPLAAIIIIAKPENVRMNVGKTQTNETANLIVPTLYVKKGINNIKNSAYMLTIRHLFNPIKTEEKREPLKIITHIVD